MASKSHLIQISSIHAAKEDFVWVKKAKKNKKWIMQFLLEKKILEYAKISDPKNA